MKNGTHYYNNSNHQTTEYSHSLGLKLSFVCCGIIFLLFNQRNANIDNGIDENYDYF